MKWIVVEVHDTGENQAKSLQDKLTEIDSDEYVVFDIKYTNPNTGDVWAHIILHENSGETNIPFTPTPIFDRVDDSGYPISRETELTN